MNDGALQEDFTHSVEGVFNSFCPSGGFGCVPPLSVR